MKPNLISVSTSGRPLAFYVDDDEPDTMILDEIYTLNRYQVLWPHLKGRNVLDIGAHKGFFSVAAAAAGAMVWAFEPNPESYKMLVKNCEANGVLDRMVLYRAGVWSLDGEREFCYPANSSGCGGTIGVENYPDQIHFNATVYSFNTIVERITDWVFLKMDVEGAEGEIIASASDKALRSIHRFGMEMHGHRENEILDRLLPFFRLECLQRLEVKRIDYLYGDRR